jgi:hypothetical protein
VNEPHVRPNRAPTNEPLHVGKQPGTRQNGVSRFRLGKRSPPPSSLGVAQMAASSGGSAMGREGRWPLGWLAHRSQPISPLTKSDIGAEGFTATFLRV